MNFSALLPFRVSREVFVQSNPVVPHREEVTAISEEFPREKFSIFAVSAPAGWITQIRNGELGSSKRPTFSFLSRIGDHNGGDHNDVDFLSQATHSVIT